MILEDLRYIFNNQITNGEEQLYYMLVDEDCSMIDRHPSYDLQSLLPMLDNFQYAGKMADMPRFIKCN